MNLKKYRILPKVLLTPLFAFCTILFLHSQVSVQTPKVKYEIYDTSYNFNSFGFSFSTINILSNLNLVSTNYHSSAFGAVDFATGSMLWERTLKEDTFNNIPSYCLAFNHYSDNTASIRISDYDLNGYYILDDNMNIVFNLNDVGIYPDNHGIAKLNDGRFAYFQDTNRIVNFYSNTIPDSSNWDALAWDVVIFDPSDSSKTTIFDWYGTVDSSFVIPEYLYEGDTDSSVIDWTHPNSIFEDYDGHLLISWRHLGVCKMDVNTGAIIWWIGLPNGLATQQGFNEPTCAGGDCITRLQHDLRPVSGMPNHYTLFDNGDTARDYSRALFFTVDTINNTMIIEKDPHFERSDFMGSLALLPNGSYLVNVPSIQDLPFNKIPGWIAQGVYNDSIVKYIGLVGSDIFFMDSNDQVVAKYWTDSANFVYNNFILDFSSWPSLYCNEDSVSATAYPSNYYWADSTANLGNDLSVFANGSSYQLNFPYGEFNGSTVWFDSKSCLGTSISHFDEWNELSIYPNPSNHILYFTEEVNDYTIFDFQGRKLLTGEGSFAVIDQLTPGTYLIVIESENRSTKRSFIKN